MLAGPCHEQGAIFWQRRTDQAGRGARKLSICPDYPRDKLNVDSKVNVL